MQGSHSAKPQGTQGSDPQLYARSFADVYDDWYSDLDNPADLVGAVAGRCPPGARVLELGSGTGRIAEPLARAGFVTIALDVSADMLARAGTAGDEASHQPTPIAADMTAIPLASGSVDAVVIAYNTLFNLTSHRLQRHCLREVARVLRGGGVFGIEGFVADDARADGDSADTAPDHGVSVRPHPTMAGASVAIVSGPHPDHDEVIVGSHIELAAHTTCRPWMLVYLAPGDIDRLADDVGLALTGRDGDWAGGAFGDDSLRHVSWYERRGTDLP